MATKSTNKTLWTTALVIAFVVVLWKLLPIFADKLKGGSSGSGGPVGGGSGIPYFPNSQQPGQGSGLSLGGGSGQEPFGSGNSTPFGRGLSLETNAEGLSAYGPGTISYYGDVSQQGYDAINNDSIASVPFTNDTADYNSFQNWFSSWFLPDQSADAGSVGPSSADTSEYEQIQTISDDTGDQVGTNDGSDLSDYEDYQDEYAYAGGDDGSGGYDTGDGGGDEWSPTS